MLESFADSENGFSELLQVAGENLTWSGVAFTALIRTLQPSPEKFDLSVGDDDAVQVRMVLLESFLEGVSIQNQQLSIVEQALRGEVADMREYVRRKQMERWEMHLSQV